MMRDEIVAAYHRGKWALVLRGVLGITLGIVIFMRPLDSAAALALVIAVWALFDGIVSIVRGFDLRSVAPHWWVMLLSGFVSAIFGLAALYYYPSLSLTFAVFWTAWWLLTAGTLGIFVAMQERKASLPWGWTLWFGITAFTASVLAFMYPGITLGALISVIASFGIVSGIVMLVGAARLQAFERDARSEMRTPSRA